MANIRFCPYCANELHHSEAKFCGKCGKSLDVLHKPSSTTGKMSSSLEGNGQLNQQLAKTKEGAQKAFSKIKQATQESQLTEKAKDYASKVNQNPKQKKNILTIGGIVLVALCLFLGWSWFSNGEYRQAMANGNSYFSQGEFGKATEFYQQAHDEKPGDKKSMEMVGYSKELGSYWVQINEDDFSGFTSQLVEEIEQKAKQMKNKDVGTKYTEVADTIKKSNWYQM